MDIQKKRKKLTETPKTEIITTADGSSSLYLPQWDETYHSRHGAIQEAYHVFIKNGLDNVCKNHPKAKTLHILEMGFGTGLNALVTMLESEKHAQRLSYVAVEAFPVSAAIANQLNYGQQLAQPLAALSFQKIHDSSWNEKHPLNPTFSLQKLQMYFEDVDFEAHFHLIYFDAFAARVQPELWTEVIFEKMYKTLKPGGVLVTYAAKGDVRRAMQKVGFQTEKLPGPPGKREMLRATKTQP
ncbi:MAG: tRNA (5-methylaminomethyl-2-thiouridine)(34)-methyltransferase MnmD [Bacteroidetes bacterium]|nr:tRNA (5-methylaminomethyl-2-thiouridine)(34)-methyltransferase MnmD [Bacteroidota bacterium]